LYFAERQDTDLPLIRSVRKINEVHRKQ